MKIVCIGGGPGGLYFAALMKRQNASYSVRVIERGRRDESLAFGIAFSEAASRSLSAAEQPGFELFPTLFTHWNDIETHYRGRVLRSVGHGFHAIGRSVLISTLQRHCEALGVQFEFERKVEDLSAFTDADIIVAADGARSTIRDLHGDRFQPEIDNRSNRFNWLGTTYPYDALNFLFKQNEAGLWRVYAFRYDEEESTFIVECTQETLRKAGLVEQDEAWTLRYLEKLFAAELRGHPLIARHSRWRTFPTVRCRRWWFDNVVLMGDAAHTAHFSVGSGAKMAMEDAIALSRAIVRSRNLEAAFRVYEEERRGAVESVQQAAQASLEWFENTERYMKLPPIQFESSLLTRSLRITHDGLKQRDPALGARIERSFAEGSILQSGQDIPLDPPPPPMFCPFRLRDLQLDNRIVVSPISIHSAVEGTVGDWHLVHLGSRAIGGAGLLLCETTGISPEGRADPRSAGLYRDEHVAAWRRINEFIHQNSRARVGVLLGHVGAVGAAHHWPEHLSDGLPLAPCQNAQVHGGIETDEMARVREHFADAAQRAEDAGFDLLELHFTQGYLFSSLVGVPGDLGEASNRLSLDTRMGYALSVFDAVRAAWPAHKPVSVRLSADGWSRAGLTTPELVTAARMLKQRKCDILDVAVEESVVNDSETSSALSQISISELLRLEVEIPTISSGNFSSFEDINSVLVAGRADLVGLARGHVFDPYLSRHAAYHFEHELPWPTEYRSTTRFAPRFDMMPRKPVR